MKTSYANPHTHINKYMHTTCRQRKRWREKPWDQCWSEKRERDWTQGLSGCPSIFQCRAWPLPRVALLLPPMSTFVSGFPCLSISRSLSVSCCQSLQTIFCALTLVSVWFPGLLVALSTTLNYHETAPYWPLVIFSNQSLPCHGELNRINYEY